VTASQSPASNRRFYHAVRPSRRAAVLSRPRYNFVPSLRDLLGNRKSATWYLSEVWIFYRHFEPVAVYPFPICISSEVELEKIDEAGS